MRWQRALELFGEMESKQVSRFFCLTTLCFFCLFPCSFCFFYCFLVFFPVLLFFPSGGGEVRWISLLPQWLDFFDFFALVFPLKMKKKPKKLNFFY